MGSRDHRRFTGPDKTFSLEQFMPAAPSGFLGAEGGRRDGRAPLQMRKVFVQPDVVAQATGSAYVEMGSTKVGLFRWCLMFTMLSGLNTVFVGF